MKDVKPACWSWFWHWVAGSPVWCASSGVSQHRRPWPCKSPFGQVIGGLLVVYRPILERGALRFELIQHQGLLGWLCRRDNWVVSSLRSSAGGTGALGLSMSLRGPLFRFMGNYVLGVSLLPEMLTSMRLVMETMEDSSRWVGHRLCLKLLVWGKGVSTPILRRTE